MKKVVAVKYCDPEFLKGSIKKTRELFLRLKLAFCAICTMASVLAAGCAKSIEEEPEATATQNPIEQTINKDASTPSSTPTPTATPMDPSFITPIMPVATPVPQTTLSEEEMIVIAKEYYQRLKAIDPDFQYSEEDVLDQIKQANGIFEWIKWVDLSNEEELTISKESHFNINISFLDSYEGPVHDKIQRSIDQKEQVDFSGFKGPETYKIYSPNFEGINTFKAVENSILKIYNSLGSWDELSTEGLKFLQSVEAFYLDNSSLWGEEEITPFKKCHPDIRFRMTNEIYWALYNMLCVQLNYLFDENGNRIEDRYSIGERELKYSLGKMVKIIYNDNYENNEITGTTRTDILALMDAYIAMSEQGVYDAYLTGDVTRKAIIRALCVKGEINLY